MRALQLQRKHWGLRKDYLSESGSNERLNERRGRARGTTKDKELCPLTPLPVRPWLPAGWADRWAPRCSRDWANSKRASGAWCCRPVRLPRRQQEVNKCPQKTMIRQERLIGCPGFNWDILGLGSIHCTGSFISWHPVRQDGLGLTHTHTHTHAHMHTHARTHTRTHTHAHAHTHAHSFIYPFLSFFIHPQASNAFSSSILIFSSSILIILHLFFIHAQPFIQCVFSSPQVNHATHIRTVTTSSPPPDRTFNSRTKSWHVFALATRSTKSHGLRDSTLQNREGWPSQLTARSPFLFS